jgi:hypothetical protein
VHSNLRSLHLLLNATHAHVALRSH